MKSVFIVFTVVASLFFNSSFARNNEVEPAVLQSFKATFANATEADWSITDNLHKVQFMLNGQHANAFYTSDGTLVAVTRNISFIQLPITLQAAVKKEYTTSWISGLFELSNDEGTQYYLTLENADTKVILKSASTAKWSVYQKIKK